MYVVRFNDLRESIDPKRKLVKLSDPNIWKKPWPIGIDDWQGGHEIHSDSIGISLFREGADQKVHYHERTWELYQVLEGSLKIAVKPYAKAEWNVILLNYLDMILLIPGTLHLVDSGGHHVTQVIQTPPAISDQIIVTNPDEVDAARKVLKNINNN